MSPDLLGSPRLTLSRVTVGLVTGCALAAAPWWMPILGDAVAGRDGPETAMHADGPGVDTSTVILRSGPSAFGHAALASGEEALTLPEGSSAVPLMASSWAGDASSEPGPDLAPDLAGLRPPTLANVADGPGHGVENWQAHPSLAPSLSGASTGPGDPGQADGPGRLHDLHGQAAPVPASDLAAPNARRRGEEAGNVAEHATFDGEFGADVAGQRGGVARIER